MMFILVIGGGVFNVILVEVFWNKIDKFGMYLELLD